ncbi:MAG: site-2 protease family protein [Candidatus Pacebacteria bacterium]|nr:site-2 protease family protein [Candidatus Paceibacterota bacterium]
MDTSFILIILILIMSVVIHEVSHGYSAYLLGDSTAKNAGRLTLNPLAHLDFMGSIIIPFLAFISTGFVFGWAKPVPYNPYNLKNQRWGDAIVAIAGPASNFAVALIFGLIIRFSAYMGISSLLFLEAAQLVVLINLVLMIFNLVPIPPLDGSKILFSVIPYRYIKIREVIERYSFILLIFLIFFLWKLILPIIFVLFSILTGIGIY